MDSFKFLLLFVALAISSVPAHSFFIKKKIVEIPLALKPIHAQPIIFEKPEIHEIHHIEQPAPVPLFVGDNSHWQMKDAWNSLKNSLANHKIVKYLYHKKHPVVNAWPSLGYNQYKKVQYIPVLHTDAPIQVHYDEGSFLSSDFTNPIISNGLKDFETSGSGNQINPGPVIVDQTNHNFIPTPAINYGLPNP